MSEDKDKDKKETKEVKKAKKYLYKGNSIDFFIYDGRKYTLHPGCVMENLPADAPQVKNHIKAGNLKGV